MQSVPLTCWIAYITFSLLYAILIYGAKLDDCNCLMLIHIYLFFHIAFVNVWLFCFSACFSISISGSNSRTFISGSCDATARLWDTRVASRAVQTFHGHEGDVSAVKFFPDGNRFGTGSDDGTCRLFDIRTGHELQVYHQLHNDNTNSHVTSIAFSISGRLLFAGYKNGDCYVWDTLLAKVFML